MAPQLISVSIDQIDELTAERDVRLDRGDVDDLARSTIEYGILTALTIVPSTEGRYTIHAGHRRRAAIRRAVEMLAEAPEEFGLDQEKAQNVSFELAEQIPAQVRPDLAGRDALTQLAENSSRKDLTEAEQIRGMQMALDDGLDERSVAHASGRRVSDVRDARKVRGLPEQAQRGITEGQLDLATAVQLGEFGDDPDTIERILKADGAYSGALQHAIARERVKRERAADAERLRAEATAAGWMIVGKPGCANWSGSDGPEELFRYLQHPDGTPLSPEDDAGIDGHAVWIDRDHARGACIVHLCKTPEEHGHVRTRFTSYKTPTQIAEEEQRKAAATELQLGMEAARCVRADFLRSLIGSQKAAAAHLELLTTIVVQWPNVLNLADRHDLAEQLLPRPLGEHEEWTQARRTHHAVARAIVGIDASFDALWAFHRDDGAALWWAQALAEHGYGLSEAEEQHVEVVRTKIEERRREREAREARRAALEAAAVDTAHDDGEGTDTAAADALDAQDAGGMSSPDSADQEAPHESTAASPADEGLVADAEADAENEPRGEGVSEPTDEPRDPWGSTNSRTRPPMGQPTPSKP